MAKRIHKFEGFTIHDDSISIEVGMKTLTKNINRAQYALDSAVMTSMEPFMPKQSGQFINVTKGMSAAIAGSGQVVAAAPPAGRFLYEGKTMVDIKTGSPWARKAAKKVLVSEYGGKTKAKQNLTYSGGGVDHWFKPAKEKDKDNWVKVVKGEVGK